MRREPANAGRDIPPLIALNCGYAACVAVTASSPFSIALADMTTNAYGGSSGPLAVATTSSSFVSMRTRTYGLMLHSGSRNIGNIIGQTAISAARERALRENVHLPDRDLAWLDEGSAEFADYVEALNWAQECAALNRDLMLARVLHAVARAMGREIDLLTEVVNCHHNYASLEQHFGERRWITRKGAVSARAGELGIVPGSMGARSFIVRGKGNPDSYSSCSHGAGRRTSCGEAKRRFTQQDLKEQTRGIECRKDAGVLDEIPAAYKDIEDVMRAQADLVRWCIP